MSAQTTDEVQVTVASIDLLGGALRSLDAAITSSRAGEKYVAAHLAAWNPQSDSRLRNQLREVRLRSASWR